MTNKERIALKKRVRDILEGNQYLVGDDPNMCNIAGTEDAVNELAKLIVTECLKEGE